MSTLTHFLQEKIAQQQGAISFADYMETVLYHPQYGLYNQHDFLISKSGHFATAPELTNLFAQCFAQEFIRLKTNSVVELGAGSGQFALDFLRHLENTDALPKRYIIIELSEHLQRVQQKRFKQESQAIQNCIGWQQELPAQFNGMVIANEVLDALPFERFQIVDDMIFEQQVQYQQGLFSWKLTTPNAALKNEVMNLLEHVSLPNHYQSELCLSIKTFIKTISDALNSGTIYLIDYGYPMHEYYHHERKRGTLNCIMNQEHCDNPFLKPGAQDITAHVNFSQVVELARQHHLKPEGFYTQANFLIAAGLLDLAQRAFENCTELERFNLSNAIKLLTFPGEMGEVMKVLVLSKNSESHFNWPFNKIYQLD